MKDDSSLSRRIRVALRTATSRWRPLPSVLIIGAQKCGTTSLFNYLVKHPQINRGRTKEVHYFDLNYTKGEPWYRAQFPITMRPTGNRHIDATPLYLFDQRCPERAAALIPSAHIIVLLRSPTERAYSQYQHSVRRGHENRPFIEAIGTELERIDPDDPLKRFSGESFFSFRQHSYVRRGIYAPQIRGWLNHFDRRRMLILDANYFFSNTQEQIERTFDFIGVSRIDIAGLSVHKQGTYNEEIPEQARQILDSFYTPYNVDLREMVNEDISWLAYKKPGMSGRQKLIYNR